MSGDESGVGPVPPPRGMTFDLKALVAAVAVALAGGGAAGSAIGGKSSGDLVAYQLEVLSGRVEELAKKLDQATADRFTSADAKDRAASVDRRLEALEARLDHHSAEPWHTRAGAEHSETKRRVDKLEAEVERLRARDK